MFDVQRNSLGSATLMPYMKVRASLVQAFGKQKNFDN